MSGRHLSDAERGVLQALAEAAIPPGRVLHGAGEDTLRRTEDFLGELPAGLRRAFRAGLWAVELQAWPRFGHRFSSLPPGRRLEALAAWHAHEATRLMLRGLLAPLKVVHFESQAAYDALGLRFTVPPPAQEERPPRWREQILPAGEQGGDVELECEAVVVGTGAGGAPVAAELASRGVAVLMLEEGRYHGRADFRGRPVPAMREMYRAAGATIAYGNTAIPVPVGRAVGGTTLINSGTCFRTPDAVLNEWAARGLTGLSPRLMAPYLDRVWEELQVGPSTREALGKPAALVARGADALGWSHHPLDRNAPGCDGQGLCCFGCPTDAKRSSNVSWVPKALGRGAQVLTGVKVTRVLLDGDKAVGVEGVATSPAGAAVRVTVRARVVVLAAGTLGTPALLLSQGLCNASGQLGKNLSIHPAAAGMGLFDEEVNASRTVPQGYAVDEFKHEGVYFEGASVPVEVQAASLMTFGPAFTMAMEEYNRSLTYGFMVKDTSRGRVRAGPNGEPLLSYWLDAGDLGRLRRGLALLGRLFFAAGAREVYLPVMGWERLRSVREVEALEQAGIQPRHVDLSAYHPLGTSKMGVDPFSSVVGPDHEAHDVHNLYVCDGSAVPGPPGVNPQVTIMAMALRAADGIAKRLERLQGQGVSASAA